ncbi:hypothetical protein PoB_004028200 [Plakobranchus ocellatus]|uniref:AIG1-type G domain-containing protein n=1 Tax=Plakobranchus ocellatus TaxID=259542 RepID=A0AAV4B2N6_9GAST|nr:hypothetical protein PoB_004028200 [Plakobranchus ocellatus]
MANVDHFDNERKGVEKELTFDDWCRRQSGVFRELWKGCEGRALLFDNTSQKKEPQDRQIEKSLTMVNEMQTIKSSDRTLTVEEKIDQERELFLDELRKNKPDLQYIKLFFHRNEKPHEICQGGR